MIRKILIGVLLALIGIVIYAATQPANYVVSRSTTINAPADKIFPYLNNQRLAEQWGPWKEVDPQAKQIFSGPEAGIGAKASWDSQGQLGTGSATIVESIPNQRVRIELEYMRPMAMTQISDYIIEANGNETKVTWRVEGINSLMGRVMGIFVNMDHIVGSMFEKGLANLKQLSEMG